MISKPVKAALFDHQFAGDRFLLLSYLKYVDPWYQAGDIQGIGRDAIGENYLAKHIIHRDYLGVIVLRSDIDHIAVRRVGIELEIGYLLRRRCIRRFFFLSETPQGA